ncbi:hypothetical protein Taro_034106 [Colocasia esculenta]|uniref:Uncharacterized protein n=1 Tax=Colocasia esculenta TaxID=4460 RepID=A0A843VQF2_COLES|nr:hypothetical protein [Colocasia esculenta]
MPEVEKAPPFIEVGQRRSPSLRRFGVQAGPPSVWGPTPAGRGAARQAPLRSGALTGGGSCRSGALTGRYPRPFGLLCTNLRRFVPPRRSCRQPLPGPSAREEVSGCLWCSVRRVRAFLRLVRAKSPQRRYKHPVVDTHVYDMLYERPVEQTLRIEVHDHSNRPKLQKYPSLPGKLQICPYGAGNGKDNLTVRASCPTRWSRTHVTSLKRRALSWVRLEAGLEGSSRESQQMTGTSGKARNRPGRPEKPEIGRDVQKSQKSAGTPKTARNRPGRPENSTNDRDVRKSQKSVGTPGKARNWPERPGQSEIDRDVPKIQKTAEMSQKAKKTFGFCRALDAGKQDPVSSPEVVVLWVFAVSA